MSEKIDFLNLDPDEVMKNYSVVEVEVVGGRLQREVDTKREELRVMVGERYRDLIEAADTIQTMKTSADNIIKGVSLTLSSCHHLVTNNSSLHPTKLPDCSISIENQSYLSVAASIQLLMTAPEKIWQAVDRQELLAASQLYQLAQYVYTGLQGEQGGGISPDRISRWFPVISRYYATINNFYTGIINSAKQCLLTEELNSDKALQALSALLMLQGLSSEDLLDTFLQLRRQCLEQAIQRGKTESARSSLCAYLRATICTIRVVATLFSDQQQLSRVISSKTDSNTAEPILMLFGKTGVSKLHKYLPTPVLNYRTRLTKPYQDIDSSVLVKRVGDWMSGSESAGQLECTTLLKDIDTIQGVAAVRQAVWNFLQNFKPYVNWKSETQSVAPNEFKLWESLYESAVRQRIQTLISQRINFLVQNLESDLTDTSNLSSVELSDYIWQESTSDLTPLTTEGKQITPHASNLNTSSSLGATNIGLSLKCVGWSSSVKRMCNNVEEQLHSIYTEILDIGKVDSAELGPFDRYCDDEQILQHYRQTLTNSLAALVDRLRKEGGENLPDDQKGKRELYLARGLQSIPVLVTTLQYSLQSQENEYYFLLQLFKDSSAEQFWLWASQSIQIFSNEISSISSDPLALLPAWDTVQIQEDSDVGSMCSNIRIPSSVSTHVMSSVHRLAGSLHTAHAATIPDQVLNRISRKVTEILLALLTTQSGEEKLTQNVALQLNFNLNFIQNMFISSTFKDEFSDQLSNLETRINANIDPFDQSVFSGHISSRVKRTCARQLSSLCPLVPKDRVELISGWKTSSAAAQDVSNIINLTPTPPPRFQLLPTAAANSSGSAALTALGNGKTLVDRQVRPRTPNLDIKSGQKSIDVKKTAATPASQRKRDRSPVAAAAASFFGSMGSSWFGGANNS